MACAVSNTAGRLLAQGLVASILFYTVAAPFPGLYVLLRYDSISLAWFASAVFWLLCVYLTMVRLNDPLRSSASCFETWQMRRFQQPRLPCQWRQYAWCHI